MAHSLQASKRIRQNEKARIRNKSMKNEIKTLTKTLRDKVEAKDLDGAEALLGKVASKLDKAAKNNIYHRNTVARHKASNARLVSSLS
jgi:small subunit ribosomal protein S20